MSNSIYEFGSFRFDATRRTLLCEGQPVTLTPKNLETLLVFLEHRERVLEKDELMELLWPDSVVEENNLTQNISALRKALGEKPNEQRFIKTIPGRGYRFVGELKEIADEPAEVSVVVEGEEGDRGTGRHGDTEMERWSDAATQRPGDTVTDQLSVPVLSQLPDRPVAPSPHATLRWRVAPSRCGL